MKILEIDISNHRKLKAFHIKIDGKNMHVAGDTGTGKTSAISALWDIIEKKSDALTHGKSRGHVQVTIGDGSKKIIAKRTNTKSTSTIKLSTEDGKAVKLSDFKEMVSSLSVNPHKIIQMKPTERVATLMKAADLGSADLDIIDDKIAELEEERLDASRKASAISITGEPEKVEQVSTSALTEELMAGNEANELYNDKKRTLDEIILETDELQQKITAYRDKIGVLEQQVKENNARIKKGSYIVSGLKEKVVDTRAIANKLNTAEEINNKYALRKKWEEDYKEKNKWIGKNKECDDAIKELREEKKNALDNAKWPLKGLSIRDGDIVYNDCLLENLGESEQMLVCAALAVEDIKNHDIKVVRMDGTESMSASDFKKLEKIFNANDVQVLSTRVSRGDVEEGEIEIVEGEYLGCGE